MILAAKQLIRTFSLFIQEELRFQLCKSSEACRQLVGDALEVFDQPEIRAPITPKAILPWKEGKGVAISICKTWTPIQHGPKNFQYQGAPFQQVSPQHQSPLLEKACGTA